MFEPTIGARARCNRPRLRVEGAAIRWWNPQCAAAPRGDDRLLEFWEWPAGTVPWKLWTLSLPSKISLLLELTTRQARFHSITNQYWSEIRTHRNAPQLNIARAQCWAQLQQHWATIKIADSCFSTSRRCLMLLCCEPRHPLWRKRLRSRIKSRGMGRDNLLPVPIARSTWTHSLARSSCPTTVTYIASPTSGQ